MEKTTATYMTSNLITALASESLELAYARMRSNQVRHLPVLNQEGRVIGIVSDRDFLRAMRGSQAKGASEFLPQAIVADEMTASVETINEDTPLLEAAQKMIREKISALVVIKGPDISGIITSEDLLRVLVELLPESENEMSLKKAKAKVLSFAAHTPVGSISQMLANAGI